MRFTAKKVTLFEKVLVPMMIYKLKDEVPMEILEAIPIVLAVVVIPRFMEVPEMPRSCCLSMASDTLETENCGTARSELKGQPAHGGLLKGEVAEVLVVNFEEVTVLPLQA